MNPLQDDWREVIQRGERVLAPTYKRPECLFVDGRGARLVDAAGREYLDMSSGIAVLALGHRPPLVAEALSQAAERLVHVSNLYHGLPPIELAERLVAHSFADRVFFANSGTEAVEAAIKFARLAGGAERREILAFEGAFHGRTLGALAATDRPDYQQPFTPLPGGFARAPWCDDAALQAIGEQTAAVLVEPIQGEKGVRVVDGAWLRALRQRCDAVGALLVFDEIQCGLGRSGRLWAHQLFGVEPDMMTLAKPLGGGLPIGAVLMRERVAETLSPGMHGTTFGANLLVTAVACAVFDRIQQPAFLEAVERKGRTLRAALDELDVAEVRGVGLMVGVQVHQEPKAVVQAAFDLGLLVVPSADRVIRILPPLDVTEADLEQAVELFGRALRRAAGEENA